MQAVKDAFADHQAQLTRRFGSGWEKAGPPDVSVRAVTYVYKDNTLHQQATVELETDSDLSTWFTLHMQYGPVLGTRYICGQSPHS